MPAAALPQLLRSAQWMGFSGLNITYPCKQSVMAHLDEISDEARAIGAVNTVVFRDGRSVGYNTDAYGFAEGFRRALPDVRRRRVVLLGAGGAGYAVGFAALGSGVEVLQIIDPIAERARQRRRGAVSWAAAGWRSSRRCRPSA